jgi:hypothetical protein
VSSSFIDFFRRNKEERGRSANYITFDKQKWILSALEY